LEAFAPERSLDLSHDFGVVYTSSGIQPSTGTDAEEPVTDHGAVAVAALGARAPHAWVTHAGERLSTIDLFEGRLTVLTGRGDHALAEAVSTMPNNPVQVLVVGRDVIDVTGDLERRYRLAGGHAVLVRPDGHVAWRLAADDIRGLDEALATILSAQPAAAV
jgi:hypothetical protein